MSALVLALIVAQTVLIVPTAVEHAENGHDVVLDSEGNHSALAIVGDSQSRSHVLATGSPCGKQVQALAIPDDGVRVAERNSRRSG